MSSIFNEDNVNKSNVYDTMKEEINCSICLSILDDPKQCSVCEILFCSQCISTWVDKNKSCPFKCANFKIEDASRIIKNMLSKLEFKCEVCEKFILYDKMKPHKLICKKIEYVCCPICKTPNISSQEIDEYIESIIKGKEEALASKYSNEIKNLKNQILSLESIIEVLKNNQENNSNNIKSSISVLKSDIKLSNSKEDLIKAVEYNEIYIWKNQIAGTNELSDIKDKSLLKGFCINSPGYLIFELSKVVKVERLSIGGYKGNTRLWAPSNGSNSIISVGLSKFDWTEIGKIPSSFANKIVEVNPTKVLDAKYIKIQSKGYLGLGYFAVNEALELSSSSTYELKLFSTGGYYLYNGRTVGNNKIEDLLDRNLTKIKGFCLNTPGKIEFTITPTIESSSIEIGGYNAEASVWWHSNGQGAKIEVSTNSTNWTSIGVIPNDFGSSIKTISFAKRSFNRIRITHNSYLGISYLNLLPGSNSNNSSFSITKEIYSNFPTFMTSTGGFYLYNNAAVGSHNIEDLKDKELTAKDKGLCFKLGETVFTFANVITSKSLEIGGYGGNSTVWYADNGNNAEISVSSTGGNDYVKIGNVPSGFGSSIKTLTYSERSFKYLKIKHSSYYSVRYLNVKSSSEAVDNNAIKAVNSNCMYSHIILKNKYSFGGKTAGTNKVEDLLDNNPLTGVCSNMPGEIIIHLKEEKTFDCIESCGWSGDTSLWSTTNGSNSDVEISKDLINWTKITTLSTLSDSVTSQLIEPSTSKYVRIKNNGYLGLGTFRLVSTSDQSLPLYPISYEIEGKYTHNFEIRNVSDLADRSNSYGLCANKGGKIIIDFGKDITFSKIESKGFTGNSSGWHPSQGMGSNIYASKDKQNWTLIGALPKSHGASIISFNTLSTTARYVKIENLKGYIGIGYLGIISQ